jgi:hypothetical protein
MMVKNAQGAKYAKLAKDFLAHLASLALLTFMLRRRL